MAQEEQIIDLLLELKRSSDSNSQSFDSLLSRISAKLDYVDNKPSIELLRTYIKELSSSVEEKYTTTQNKFLDIEKALRAVYALQGEQIKNTDIHELFDAFNKNVTTFSVEAKQNKAVLSGIENKLSDIINNKTDKEDILRTISLLRKDFENVNNVYKHTIDDVNSNLKTIISGLIKLDPLKTNEAVKSQIDIMFNSINGIVMQLQSFDKRQDKLEQILNQVATGEDLKITKGIIDEIIEKTTEIENSVNKLPEKSDIDKLSEQASGIAKKVLSKEDIADLVHQTDDMLNNTKEIKNALGQITNDLEKKPNSEEIETSLKNIYKKMENLTDNISASNVKGDVFDISTRLTSIKDELYTIKNITADLNEAINTKILDTIESITNDGSTEILKNNISEVLNQIPTKEDIEKILSDNNDVLKELVTKTSYIAENIASIPAVIEKVEAIKESQNDLSEDIATSLSKLNFEKEFSCIYDKTNSIENWLEKSNIKENSEKMVRQMEKHTEQADMTILNTQIEGIVKNLEDLSQSRDIGKVGNNITDIGSKIDNLTKIVKNIEKNDTSSYVSRLADIEAKITHIASVEDFSSFVNEIRRCITQIGSGHDNVGYDLSDIRSNQSDLNERIKNLDFSEVTDFLDGKFNDLEKNISSILDSNEELKKTSHDLDEGMDTLTTYIKSNLPVDTEYLEHQMAEIKDIIETKVVESYKERNKSEDASVLGTIEQYTKEIREILNNQPCVSVKEELSEKILNIETHIIDTKEFNENAFLQVLNKIDSFGESVINNVSEESNLNAYIDELSELRDQVSELGQAFKESEYKKEQIEDAKTDERIAQLNDFIADKISELSNNFEALTGVSGDKLQDKFNYNAELLETKTAEIIKFIEEVKSSSDNNVEFNSLLEDTSAKLADYKQELELISTDITETINRQADKLVDEINPIKEILLQQTTNSELSEIKKQLTEIHENILSDSEIEFDSNKLNDIYTKVKDKLQQSENNLKDFILSDTDSIILKLDNIKEFVENSLKGFQPVSDLIDSKNQEVEEYKKELDEFVSNYNQKLDNVLEVVNAAGLEQQNIASLVQDGIDKQQILADEIKERLSQQDDVVSLVKETAQSQENIESLIKESISSQQDIAETIKDRIDSQGDVASLVKETAQNQENIESLIKESISSQQDIAETIKDRIESQGDVASLVKETAQNQENIESLIKESISSQQDIAETIKDRIESQGDVASLVKETAQNQENIESLIKDGICSQQEFSDFVKEKLNEHDEINTLVQQNSDVTKGISSLVKQSLEKQDNINFQIDDGFITQKETLKANQEELKSLLAVAMNHDDIIVAIDDLRDAFGEKIARLNEISSSILENSSNNNQEEIDSIVEDLKDTFARTSLKIDKLSMKNTDIESVLDTISGKIDELLSSSTKAAELSVDDIDISEKNNTDDQFDFIQAFDLLQQDISELRNTIKKTVPALTVADGSENVDPSLVSNLSAKVDVVMQSLDSNDALLDTLGYKIEELISSVEDNKDKSPNENLEDILKSVNNNWLSDIKNYLDDSNINSMLKAINEKLDILATADDSELLEDISYTLNDVDSAIVPAVKNLSESDKKITSMLETLNEKINSVMSDNGGTASNSNIDDIKTLILEQKEYINKLEPTQGIDTFKKCLDELSGEVNNLSTNANEGNAQIKTSLHEMKDSIMAAVVAIFDQVSFVEESEDIKDFVEERTNEINQKIENITKQIEQISVPDVVTDKIESLTKQLKQLTSEEDNSYTYSMQDIETDLSKLRVALKEIQEGSSSDTNLSDELSKITSKLKEVATSVDLMSQDEIKDLKTEISSLKEQTQFLIATSDKSYNALNVGLGDFGEILQDNLTGKVDSIAAMLEKSEASDAVIKQALIYMGEWIDSTSGSFDKINENAQGIEKISKAVNDLNENVETNISELIETKLKKLDKKFAKIDALEEQFAQQDERIDRLEKNLDKVLSAIENLEDNSINRKIDKIEKQISKLSTNIEKLTSYVDD